MGSYLEKKDVKKALEDAKRLEEQELLPMEKIVELYKEGVEETAKLQKLLKQSWFIKDTDKPASKKARKPAKKSVRKSKK